MKRGERGRGRSDRFRARPPPPLARAGLPGAIPGLLALSLLGLPPAAGEPSAAGRAEGPPAIAADSERVVREAREAQARFERLRRQRFPRAPHAVGRCDEHVGRFCLWYEEDDDWRPAPEHPAVKEARRALIVTLDVAADSAPGDGWLLGQRVRYRVESDRLDEALALARACRLQPGWWCQALAGFTHHAAARYEEAESAFERALSAMPEAERCGWTDLDPILRGRGRGRYRDATCDARAAFERVFWHLADPLWLVPGNERRSEHFSRQVWNALQEDAASGYGVRWGRDLDQLVSRYGWPAGWDVAWRRDPGIRTERAIQSHRLPEAQELAPPAGWVLGPAAGGDPEEWDLDTERARSSWAPPYGRLEPLPHQLARFRRGGRALVVAAFDPPGDRGAGCAWQTGLFLSGPDRLIASATGRSPGLRVGVEGRLWGRGARRFIGVEARCGAEPLAARARYEIAAPDARISDILLISPSEPLPGTLDAAIARARGSLTVRTGEEVGLYWEWYGAATGPEPLSTTLVLEREGKGFLRKALEWTGLAARRQESVGLRWTEIGSQAPRSIRLRLPDLPEGRYRLTVEVRSPSLGVASSSRDLVVEG